PMMRLHFRHRNQQVAGERGLREVDGLKARKRSSQADFGHAIKVEIGEDPFKSRNSVEISRSLCHIQRVPPVPRTLSDKNLGSEFAKSFQGGVHQQRMGI